MLLAPLLLSTLLTLLVLFIAAVTEPNSLSALGRTLMAAFVFTGTMAVFTVTFGATGVGLLLFARQRGFFVWIATGILFGVVFAMAHSIYTVGLINDMNLVFGAGLGGLLFALIRWIAGIRD